ncbi:MAG: anhydro-N-acetylmuramic acid kinase [Sphingobacteriales bacterium]|nr:anhydro-N-acetylmuramic acid kinase [Sphingobacteriales bacterium]
MGLEKLVKTSLKPERIILGLMSGTSLDGLDMALCKISGHGLQTKVQLIAFETHPYNKDLKDSLQSVCFKKNVDLENLTLLNSFISDKHAEYILSFLKKNNIKPNAVDFLASHGQTVFHSPKNSREKDRFNHATLQIGDGDMLAVKTGMITLSDFRQKNVAEGKEGAPLAIYGDYLLFQNPNENRILLNIGGISNFTFIPAGAPFTEVTSTDVGPGNTLMDQVCRKFFGKFFDEDANLARQGKSSEKLLHQLLTHPFFKANFPKSTGPELFNLEMVNDAIMKAEIHNLSKEDLLATLNKFTAKAIADAITYYEAHQEHLTVYISGGGLHNPLLLQNLKEYLPQVKFLSLDTLNINPDAKEAILFAILANETIYGDMKAFGPKALSMGKISLPY